MTVEGRPYIAPVFDTESLILQPMPNGGWVVQARDHSSRDMARNLGAFSNTEDMLQALCAGYGFNLVPSTCAEESDRPR